MKLFIVTLSSFQGDTEFVQWAESLASLAIKLENQRLRVRAIEEVPADADVSMHKTWEQFTVGEADQYIMRVPGDGVFPYSGKPAIETNFPHRN